jgi:hypothetical protein
MEGDSEKITNIHLQTKEQNKCHIIHVKGFGLGQQVSLLKISFNTLISKNINIILDKIKCLAMKIFIW